MRTVQIWTFFPQTTENTTLPARPASSTADVAAPPSTWPPGLTWIALAKCPASLREDAIQAAWVAHLEGRIKPDSAVRQVLRHEVRHNAIRLVSESIDPDTLRTAGP